MRIGEIAALVGVTSRAVRHYHHIGLLPEPARQANGYRAYGITDAVLLARVRRLTELGLSLDEVRDVLADDAGRELAEVLGELDADLARQEREIQRRRKALAALLEAPPTPDAPLPRGLAELLDAAPATASPAAAKDRAYLTLLGTLPGPGDGADPLWAALRPLTEDPELPRFYDRLDALDRAPAHDPRVAALAEDIAAAVPEGALAVMAGAIAPSGVEPALGPLLGEALLTDFSPAQAAVVRGVVERLTARLGGDGGPSGGGSGSDDRTGSDDRAGGGT